MNPFCPPRPFVWLVAAAIFFGAYVSGDGAPLVVDKEEVLRRIAENVLRPGYIQLRERCLTLEQSALELTAARTPEIWRKTQTNWIAAMLAARRVQCYQAGPIVDRDAVSTFFSWRLLPARLEAAIALTRPIDAAWIDEMGIGTKGLFACEYLLFEPDLLGRTNALRRLQYLSALTEDIAKKARRLAADWADTGPGSSTVRFASGRQETLNSVLNQIAMSLEHVAEEHLNFSMHLPAPITRQLDRIENARSGTSLQAWSARLEGLRDLYLGSGGIGIEGYLRQLNAPVAVRVGRQFENAITALESVGGRFEEAVTKRRDAVERAYQAVRELEILCKLDLASALGVTITFSSNDGD